MSPRVYGSLRARVIGVLSLIDGLDYIVRGPRGGGLTLRVLFWEIEQPRLQGLNRAYFESKGNG